MNNQGYTILIVIFIIAVLSAALAYFCLANNFVNKVNQDLKTNIDEQNKIINTVDKSFYFKEADDKKDFYILDKCEMKKVGNVNDLIISHNEGYQ